MREGYYTYRENHREAYWSICVVRGGMVHFFGQCSQAVGNEYLTKYIEFGQQVILGEDGSTWSAPIKGASA